MKKIIALVMVLMLALSMVACGESKAPEAPAEKPAAAPADASAPAEGWTPQENVTIIVSYKAGSGTDNTARVLAAYAEKYIGKPVIIENVEGGSGSIGWTALSQAAPDGYTMGFVYLPNFSSSITEGLADYTVDSFKAICNHVTETSVVLVKADSQFNTLEDLVKYAQEHPGELKASTNGSHKSNHIGAQMLAVSADFEYTDIPYGGTADQLLALRKGEIDFSVAKVADFASFTSEVKVLGVFNLVGFYISTILLMLGCRGFAKISHLSDAILIPSVAVLCVVGSFAIRKNFVDVVIMIIIGVLGYLFRKFDLNPAAVVLALILGPIGEKGLRRSLLLSGGNPAILFSTPLCWVLIILSIVGICSPIFINRMEKKMVKKAGGDIPEETGDDPVRTTD